MKIIEWVINVNLENVQNDQAVIRGFRSTNEPLWRGTAFLTIEKSDTKGIKKSLGKHENRLEAAGIHNFSLEAKPLKER